MSHEDEHSLIRSDTGGVMFQWLKRLFFPRLTVVKIVSYDYSSRKLVAVCAFPTGGIMGGWVDTFAFVPQTIEMVLKADLSPEVSGMNREGEVFLLQISKEVLDTFFHKEVSGS